MVGWWGEEVERWIEVKVEGRGAVGDGKCRGRGGEGRARVKEGEARGRMGE